ncbi:MAG: hypothetical protein KAR37_14240 [Alphaproteobacteria bacterium]|jgi:hypothetical protein|nr:hypothetical protein [Alphaproteobacteria bacterium]
MEMIEDGGPELGPGPTRLKSLAQILLERVADHLCDAAANNGGKLNPVGIQASLDEFHRRADPEITDFYRTGWNECLAVIDEVRRESSRRMPFERLMVKPFAPLLPAAHQPVDPGRGLSRRVLPGFLSALQQMLGPVLLDQYQNRCRELVRIIQTARGNDFEWDDVYTDPTSQVIVNDVLVHISKHFADFDRRQTWLVGVIASEMSLGEDTVERNWCFREAEFHLLMTALFKPLRKQMETSVGQQHIKDRYGTVACELLVDLFAELDRPHNVTPLKRIAP